MLLTARSKRRIAATRSSAGTPSPPEPSRRAIGCEPCDSRTAGGQEWTSTATIRSRLVAPMAPSPLGRGWADIYDLRVFRRWLKRNFPRQTPRIFISEFVLPTDKQNWQFILLSRTRRRDGCVRRSGSPARSRVYSFGYSACSTRRRGLMTDRFAGDYSIRMGCRSRRLTRSGAAEVEQAARYSQPGRSRRSAPRAPACAMRPPTHRQAGAERLSRFQRRQADRRRYLPRLPARSVALSARPL